LKQELTKKQGRYREAETEKGKEGEKRRERRRKIGEQGVKEGNVSGICCWIEVSTGLVIKGEKGGEYIRQASKLRGEGGGRK